jgi:cytochrome c peroxidase
MAAKAMLTLCALLAWLAGGPASAQGLGRAEMLGKRLFFDRRLSVNGNQSCADCHAAEAGTTGPTPAVNATGGVYQGSVPGRFGDRKPPASAYAGDSPVLFFDEAEGVWIGGMFWDGRATGWTLGDPLAEQALGPFLNPLEQGLATPADVVRRACRTPLFRAVCGAAACGPQSVEAAYRCIGRSIAAYERSREVNAYTSKYDAFLAGHAELTEIERSGLALFEGRGMCSACHPSRPGPNGEPPLFTDFTYDNLGIPRNPLNPFYYEREWNPRGTGHVDLGLGGFLERAGFPAGVHEPERGRFKVPTLRNVDLRPEGLETGRFVKAFGHNAFFKSLKEIVHFYNTRDVEPWPPPEYEATVNREELGNLGLTSEEEDAIVAFLATLSDGHLPRPLR